MISPNNGQEPVVAPAPCAGRRVVVCAGAPAA